MQGASGKARGFSPSGGGVSHSAEVTVRTGQLADLNELRALEAGFPGDRLSPRQLRHHLRSRHAWLGVVADGTGVLGYALLLFRAGSAAARLYSIVLAPAARGRGLGRRLLEAAEAAALARGCRALQLEVRTDNSAAIALYEACGWQRCGQRRAYYEDGADAWRYGKALD